MENYSSEVQALLKDNSLLHLVAGLASECGEVCGVFQKAAYKHTDVNLENLTLELGDVLFYATALANHYNLSLEELMRINIAKLKERHSK